MTDYSERARPQLTNKEKKNLKLIIKNFDKNKIVTKQLFNQDKRLRLNSVNKSNYYFLINTEKQFKATRNKGKIIIKRINDTDYLTSSMIDKFNNKTNGILDSSASEKIFSKDYIKFTKNMINNYSDKIRNSKDLEYFNKKNESIINNLEFFDNLQIQKVIEMEKNFYKAKYNLWEFSDENNEEKDNENKEYNIDQNIIKDKFIQRLKRRTTSLRKRKNILEISPHKKSERKRRNSLILNENNRSFSDNYIKSKTKNININNKEKLDNSKDNNNSSKLKSNKNINIKDDNFSKKELLMNEFQKISTYNTMKQIKERAKTYANAIANLNYMPYQPMNHPNKELYYTNLKRAIKINYIRKHLKNINEDELLSVNPKFIKDQLLKTQFEIYKANKHKNLNYNFLKHNFREQTIRQFAYIKDSFFGIPC